MFENNFIITEKNIAEYAAYLRNEERASATIEKYIRDVKAFECFLNGANITKQSALEWRNELLENHAATTVNSALAALNGFLIFLSLA